MEAKSMWIDPMHKLDATELEEYQDYVEGGISPNVTMLPTNMQTLWACAGMVAEAGEVSAELEKAIRKGVPFNEDKLLDEVGDVLWFLTALCNTLDISLDEVIEHNIDKLNKRVANAA